MGVNGPDRFARGKPTMPEQDGFEAAVEAMLKRQRPGVRDLESDRWDRDRADIRRDLRAAAPHLLKAERSRIREALLSGEAVEVAARKIAGAADLCIADRPDVLQDFARAALEAALEHQSEGES